MKGIKLLLAVLSIGVLGCTTSPTIPEIDSNHPASEAGEEGKVDVESIPPTKDAFPESNTRKNSAPHDMGKMNHMNMKMGDR